MFAHCSLFLFCFVALSSSALADTTWPQWRGPQRNGHSEETGISTDWTAKTPKLQWMSEGMGRGYASVSVADRVIYTTGNKSDGQNVIAVSAKDGSVIWSVAVTSESPQHGHSGSRCTPSIDGDYLYVVTSAGSIACLKRKDGEQVWQRKFSEWGGKMMSGWGFSESPLVDGDTVLCTPGGKDAMMVALDKKSGKEIWASAAPADFGRTVGVNGKRLKPGAGYSSIVVSNAAGVKQYVQLTGQGVIGVRASDGKLLWGYGEVANGTANIPTPICSGDYVFCSSGYKTGAALLKLTKSGDSVAMDEEFFLEYKTFENHHGGMIQVGDYVYCGHAHNNGFPICVEMKSGKIIWGGSIRGAGSGSAAVTFVDGHLIFRYQSGDVALIEASPKGYNLKGSFMPDYQEGKSWAHPVVAGGYLFLREQDKLMCYDIK
ncbi:MAG: outer membrane protein assembly factor BamB [Pirellulaceae bacterium]|jgi:outer membrane protein assembly factor BamB